MNTNTTHTEKNIALIVQGNIDFCGIFSLSICMNTCTIDAAKEKYYYNIHTHIHTYIHTCIHTCIHTQGNMDRLKRKIEKKSIQRGCRSRGIAT
jgi:hypothetical protein